MSNFGKNLDAIQKVQVMALLGLNSCSSTEIVVKGLNGYDINPLITLQYKMHTLRKCSTIN